VEVQTAPRPVRRALLFLSLAVAIEIIAPLLELSRLRLTSLAEFAFLTLSPLLNLVPIAAIRRRKRWGRLLAVVLWGLQGALYLTNARHLRLAYPSAPAVSGTYPIVLQVYALVHLYTAEASAWFSGRPGWQWLQYRATDLFGAKAANSLGGRSTGVFSNEPTEPYDGKPTYELGGGPTDALSTGRRRTPVLPWLITIGSISFVAVALVLVLPDIFPPSRPSTRAPAAGLPTATLEKAPLDALDPTAPAPPYPRRWPRLSARFRPNAPPASIRIAEREPDVESTPPVADVAVMNLSLAGAPGSADYTDRLRLAVACQRQRIELLTPFWENNSNKEIRTARVKQIIRLCFMQEGLPQPEFKPRNTVSVSP
jgi:hypothetical protein